MKKKRYKYLYVPSVECLSCGTYLVSLSQHDYRACKCGSMVDGGPDSGYYRMAKGPKGIRDLQLYIRKEVNKNG